MQVFAATVDDERAIRHYRFNHGHRLTAEYASAHRHFYRFRSDGEECERIACDFKALLQRQACRQLVGQTFEQAFGEGLDFTPVALFKARSR